MTAKLTDVKVQSLKPKAARYEVWDPAAPGFGVRVTPKSSTNEIAGLFRASDGAVSLQVRVTAQPEKGKANKAVIKILAKELGFAKSNLEIVAGDADFQSATHPVVRW